MKLPENRTLNRPNSEAPAHFPCVDRTQLKTLQVNLGYRCNQACTHCHVEAGPNRTEMMSDEVVDSLLAVLDRPEVEVLDLTGGAPEMHPRFKDLVRAARDRDVHVIDRCNLTILEEPGYEDLGRFLATNEVEVIASLPCYLGDNVDRQRGKGVYDKSIAGLKQLNHLGYGDPATRLELKLVFNPQGMNLAPNQATLERDYRTYLMESFGIQFNQLLTITNMPINRFAASLHRDGQYEAYMERLRANFHAANLESLMCRSLISVDWQGRLYDCDFNQMLGLRCGSGTLRDLSDIDPEQLIGARVAVADHCFGCTAGQGSSCGGALT